MSGSGTKWLRAPKKRRCDHQLVELLSREGESPVPASRLGYTMVHCTKGCDSTWWEPNSNLKALGYLS